MTDLTPAVKMRVVYMANGIMLGIAQGGEKEGWLHVGDAAGKWTPTVHIDTLHQSRRFSEVKPQRKRLRRFFRNVLPLRRREHV